MEKIIIELKEKQNIRNNLSTLRTFVKETSEAKKAQKIVASDDAMWLAFLCDTDAKTRKNAALFLGDIGYQRALFPLWEAYQKEETLFVKSSYLTAISHLDASALENELHQRLEVLLAQEVAENEKKHYEEELHALRKLLISYEGITKHTFCLKKKQEVVLLTNHIHREVVRRQFEKQGAVLHPLGVKLETNHIEELFAMRSFKEVLFPIPGVEQLSSDPRQAAKQLMDAKVVELLQTLHEGDGEFYFRIECKSKMTLEERSVFAKKLAGELERLSGGALVNSTSEYEVELRLIANKENLFYPTIKCYTLKDERFAYRKNTIAASIQPSSAALMMELVKPYLKENAQVMDPFCGVGTMLIERHRTVPAKDMYATDIFGEAVEKGRENAKAGKVLINFIHRDFFDFKHEYLFDEIITNMPLRGKSSKEEMDLFYGRFFKKALEVLHKEAVIIIYTNEVGFVKKQLRLHSELQLLQETLMNKKNDFYLMVIGVKR